MTVPPWRLRWRAQAGTAAACAAVGAQGGGAHNQARQPGQPMGWLWAVRRSSDPQQGLPPASHTLQVVPRAGEWVPGAAQETEPQLFPSCRAHRLGDAGDVANAVLGDTSRVGGGGDDALGPPPMSEAATSTAFKTPSLGTHSVAWQAPGS